MGIRILFVPEFHSSPNLTGVSIFNNVLDLAKATQGKAFWYLVVPPDSSEFVPLSTQLPNVKLLPLGPEKFEPALPMNLPPTDRFVRYCIENQGNLPFDIVLNRKFNYTTELRMLMFQRDMMWRCALRTPVITYFTDAADDKDNAYLSERFSIASLMAGVISGPVVLLTEHDRSLFLEQVRQYLAFAQMRTVQDSIKVVRPSVDWERIDNRLNQILAIREAHRGVGELRLFHGGTFEGKKHVPEFVEMAQRLRAKGLPVKLVLKTQWSEERAASRDLKSDAVEVEYGVNRERYIESLGDGDVFLCASNFEGTGLAYLEASRSGMPGIFLDRPWIRDRLPKDYPFVAKTVEGMDAMVLTLIRNPETAKQVGDSLRNHWNSLFSAEKNAQEMLANMSFWISASHAEEDKKVRKFYFFEPIELFCSSGVTKFTLTELVEGCKRFARSKSVNPASFGVTYLRRAAKVCGFEDDCSGSEPVFVRR